LAIRVPDFRVEIRPNADTLGAMPNIGPTEIILLLLLALLLFGARRLPEIGRSLGQGMREFKDSVSGNSPSKSEETHTELPVGTQDTTAPAPPREREHDPVS
jgi:sec-independent protein translocase protein TatA